MVPGIRVLTHWWAEGPVCGGLGPNGEWSKMLGSPGSGRSRTLLRWRNVLGGFLKQVALRQGSEGSQAFV